MKHDCCTLRFVCAGRAFAKRQSASAVDYRIVERIDDVDTGTWDGLVAGGSLFMQRPVLAAMEATLPAGMRHAYLVLRREGQPVLAVAFQHFVVSHEQLELGAAEAESRGAAVVRRVRKYLLGALGRRVLICGDLFTCGEHGWAFAPAVTADERWTLLAQAVAHMRGRTGWKSDFVVLKDLPEADGNAQQMLGAHAFFRVPTEPSMTLSFDPAWSTMADYLHALKAKYRKAARRCLDDLEAAGMRPVPVVDLDAMAPALNALYAQVERHADVRFGVLKVDHLPKLAEALGEDRFRCTAIMRGDKALGFAATLRDGETAIAHIVGFDYAANAQAPVYLGLLYTIVSDALALGCRRIAFGRTALEPKARLGAQPETMRAYVRHRNPLVNGFARFLLNFMGQHQPPQRNPFRHP